MKIPGWEELWGGETTEDSLCILKHMKHNLIHHDMKEKSDQIIEEPTGSLW